MPEKSEAQKRAQKAYMEKFSRIELRITPEVKEAVKAAAAVSGQSVNEWISQAITEKMEKESAGA